MTKTSQTILRFVLKSKEHPMDTIPRFRPQGKMVLNRTEWRDKEPRSCAITKVRSRPRAVDSSEPTVFDVEVTYRPKGYVVFVGETKYDGWTAMILDRMRDGTLLDGHGKPLPEGQAPVYIRAEVYEDIDFNEIDFGEFVEEVVDEGIKHVKYDEVLQQMHESPHFSAGITSTFIAPRRHRPLVKIVLSNAPSGTSIDGFGTRIVNVNKVTPHLQQVLLDELMEMVRGFVEGRYSLKNQSNDDLIFVELSDAFVDCTPNEEGKESRIDCLHEYMPEEFLEDMANRLMATYAVEVSVVDGPKGGLLLKAVEPSK